MMNKILIGLLFSFTLSSYCQGNITIKLIQNTVVLKNPLLEDDNLYSGNSKYYNYLPTFQSDRNIINTMGGTLIDSLAKHAYELALNGKITVYDPFAINISGAEVSFPVIIPSTKIFQYFNSRDTALVYDPDPPYKADTVVYKQDYDPASVFAIDFLETWTINSKTMEIKKKIIAICPLIASYDPGTNEFRGFRRMFWIKM